LPEAVPPDPAVSVVIATHGRPQQLLDCLQSLRKQTLSDDTFEVVVVDDYSPVPLALADVGGGPAMHLIRTPQQSGPGAARNAGATVARGKLLAFTDDDCLPAADWLERILETHRADPQVMLGGKLYNAVPEYAGAEASQVISDIVYAWYNVDPQNARFFSTNNMAVPREDFVELGGFDESFRGASEDRDLCDRWRASGRRMRLAPQALVGHAHRLTLRKFLRQHFAYGKGAALFHRRRGERGSGRMVDEMPFHRALPRLMWNRLKHEKPGKALMLATMIGLWQAANAAGYFWQKTRLSTSDRDFD
jgi:GT2 family glycosyltransferase